MNRTALFVLSKAAKKVRKLVADDRDHLVALDKPFFVGTFRETFHWEDRDLPILPFENDKLVIDDERRLVLKVVDKPYCDGATGAPDTWRGLDLAAGYIPHDALYESLEDFLANEAWMAAGWNEYALMTLFDIVLGKMIHREEEKEGRGSFVSRLYYGAVRRLGKLYHRLTRALALVLMAGLGAGLLAGCSGCMAVPDEGFDPSDEEPVYHVEPLGD